MKCWIQRLFVENLTALFKIWRFLEGVSSPLAVKKIKQKLVPCTHQDVTFYRRHFTALTEKQGDAGAAALYGGNLSTQCVSPLWQTD